jgi:hypothetical protein
MCRAKYADDIPWTSYLYRHQSKMSSSKILACKGTLRQVFIRVYRLEVQLVMLVFSTQLCELLSFNLLSGLTLPPPFPCVNKYTVLFTRVCKWEGYGVLDLRQINTCRKVSLQVNFFRWRPFALPSISLIFVPAILTPLKSIAK